MALRQARAQRPGRARRHGGGARARRAPPAAPAARGAQGGACSPCSRPRGSPGSMIRATAHLRLPAPGCAPSRAWMRARSARLAQRLWRRACAARDGAVAAWLAQHARICSGRFRAAGARRPWPRAGGEIAARGPAAGPAHGRRPALCAAARAARPPARGAARRPAPGGRLAAAGCCATRDHLLICREAGVIDHVLPPAAGVWHRWDGALRSASAAMPGVCGAGARRRWLAAARRADRPDAGRDAARRPSAEPAGALAARRLLAVPQLGLIAPDRADWRARRGPLPAAAAARRRAVRSGPSAGSGTDAAAAGEQIFASGCRIAYVKLVSDVRLAWRLGAGRRRAMATGLHRGEAAG